MSEFKDNIVKQVEIIHNTISDDQERREVLKAVQDMIQQFTTHLVQLTERQNEMDEKITDIYDIISNMEMDDIDEPSFGTCPYCGEEIPIALKDGDYADVECPYCHKTIEVNIDDEN